MKKIDKKSLGTNNFLRLTSIFIKKNVKITQLSYNSFRNLKIQKA